MLPKEIKNYRNLILLKDGAKVLLRALTADDEGELLDLFARASSRDIRFIRDDVKNPDVIKEWCQDVDYKKVLPLIAITQNTIVGLASLHYKKGPERHIGEVRIYLAREYRRRGLGTRMLQTLIELARRQGLYFLEAEVVASQNKVVKAFQNLDFKLCCTFEDYFMLPTGETQDVIRLILNLNPIGDEF